MFNQLFLFLQRKICDKISNCLKMRFRMALLIRRESNQVENLCFSESES